VNNQAKAVVCVYGFLTAAWHASVAEIWAPHPGVMLRSPLRDHDTCQSVLKQSERKAQLQRLYFSFSGSAKTKSVEAGRDMRFRFGIKLRETVFFLDTEALKRYLQFI